MVCLHDYSQNILSEIDSYVSFIESHQGNEVRKGNHRRGVILTELNFYNDCAKLEFAYLLQYKDRRDFKMDNYEYCMIKDKYCLLMDKTTFGYLNHFKPQKITASQVDSILQNKLANVKENPYILTTGSTLTVWVTICGDSIHRKLIHKPLPDDIIIHQQNMDDFRKE